MQLDPDPTLPLSPENILAMFKSTRAELHRTHGEKAAAAPNSTGEGCYCCGDGLNEMIRRLDAVVLRRTNERAANLVRAAKPATHFPADQIPQLLFDGPVGCPTGIPGPLGPTMGGAESVGGSMSSRAICWTCDKPCSECACPEDRRSWREVKR
jgi:hypothetical protein